MHATLTPFAPTVECVSGGQKPGSRANSSGECCSSVQRTRFNLRAQSDHHDVCPQQHRCRREAHGSQPLPSREAPARFKPMLGRSTESRRFTKVARPVRSRSEISDTFQSPRRSSLASSARLHQSLLAGRRDLPAPTFQVATALCFDECLQFLRLRHSRTARRHQPGSACEPPQQRPPSREPPHRSTRPRHSHRGGLLQPCTSQRSQVTPSRCRAAVRLPNLTRRCRKPPARSQPRSRCPSEHLPKQTHARPRAPDSLLARCPTSRVSAAGAIRPPRGNHRQDRSRGIQPRLRGGDFAGRKPVSCKPIVRQQSRCARNYFCVCVSSHFTSSRSWGRPAARLLRIKSARDRIGTT
jgi:hypothetical protein